MIITLVHEEITEALKDYANKIIQVGPDREITIDLKAGRGENGYTATLDIVPKRSQSVSDIILNRGIAPVKEAPVERPVSLPEEVQVEEPEMTLEEEEALAESVMQSSTKSLFARS